MQIKEKFIIFLKGILMGICDLIPGISGGTIAFITGIYQRLISSVKNISPFKKNLKKVEFSFLFTLILGIGTALLIGAKLIKFLLDNYFGYTLSFFIGLILASSGIIFNNIKNHNLKNILFGIGGLIIGGIFTFLIPIEVQPSLLLVFIGGFFAISAMFLPGISGAFILLIMGLYGFMLEILQDILNNLSYFLIFVVGAGIGAIIISRGISFLFKKDKCKTLYVLLGVVIGSLGIPLKKIIGEISLRTSNVYVMGVLFLLGILLVTFIRLYEKS